MPLHIRLLLEFNLKFNFMFRRLINNTLKDLSTSVIGAIAGMPDLIEGITSKDLQKIVKGAGVVLLGLFMNSKTKI